MSHEIHLQFRTPPERGRLDFEDHLAMVQRFTQILGAEDALLGESAWYLCGDTKDDSYRYPVFRGDGPATAALAVLNQEVDWDDVMKSFALWNGQLEITKGASISYYFDRTDGAASAWSLALVSKPPSSRLGAWTRVAKVICEAVKIWRPLLATVDTRNYDGVFPDRPGVGWMIYLPTVLTEHQVPEARALIGVEDEGNQQMGTIVVSVTDGPFSGTDPEHVRSANAIEVRLVDQDLLPRYVDL
ncbi:immunity protein 52 of polymorphic toxin system [Cupriavidus alkaliphilus]|nr:immunity protein 52 of polymorphic toxin system [Cupriavidus alkaliphilus]